MSKVRNSIECDMKPKILNIHHAQISIPVGHEAQAREFYCGLLGLKEIEKPAPLRDRGGFWLGLGELQIHFGAEDGVEREKTKAHLAYLVSDLEGWRKKLAEARIVIKESIPIAGYARFEFRDPFGNRVEFL